MNRRTVAWTLLAAAVLFACLAVTPARAGTWSTTTIDAEGDVGRYADLMIDASGGLHVVYLRNDNHTLKVITNTGGVWGAPEVVDNSGSVGTSCAIALDAAGHGKLAYRRTDQGSAWYAGAERPRAWATSTIAQTGDVGRSTSLVILPDDEIGLAYRSVLDGALHHLRRVGGVWGTPVVVDAGPNRGQYADLAYRAGVGYVFSEYDAANGALLLADRTLHARPWSIEAATNQADDVGRGATLLMEQDGSLTAAFRNQTRGSLQYVRRAGGVWGAPVTVDPGPARGNYIDVAARPGAGYAFAEYGQEEGSLLFADPVLHARPWSVSAITHEDDDVGRGLALVSRADGELAVAYRNATQGTLQHVRRVSGAWTVPVTVDGGVNRGQYCDLVRLPDGRYGFSEYEPAQGSILLAHPSLRALPFKIQRVDGILDAGRQLSLFRRATDRLDCAYMSAQSDGRLKLRVAEIVPNTAFIVRTVADSVSMTVNGAVTPDLYVTGSSNWRISYRKPAGGDLYLASTDNFQLLPGDVPDAPGDTTAAGPKRTVLAGSYPNPARAAFRVRFSSAEETSAEISLYDAQGQLVRRIGLGCRRGDNEVGFDGRNGAGSTLSAGVYFVRVKVGPRDLGTRKIVLLGGERR